MQGLPGAHIMYICHTGKGQNKLKKEIGKVEMRVIGLVKNIDIGRNTDFSRVKIRGVS